MRGNEDLSVFQEIRHPVPNDSERLIYPQETLGDSRVCHLFLAIMCRDCAVNGFQISNHWFVDMDFLKGSDETNFTWVGAIAFSTSRVTVHNIGQSVVINCA